jgi:hypothetical protein
VLLVHTPKVLTPNDFQSLNELEQRLLAFQRRYQETVSPLQWTFTRKGLAVLLAKINGSFTPPDAPSEYVTVISNDRRTASKRIPSAKGHVSLPHLNVRLHGHAWSKQVLGILPFFKHNLHGNPLHHLDVISCRVLWRE